MKFLRLRLQGFKSFVDPTELLIEPGLTGVVGPNGCGKSNLLEAVRWVMGESSAKAMRGEGMDDVIFAGSSSRAAKARAEVAITLDNSDRGAPPGFNEEDKLDIARRIARDIGSSFRVNGKEARARDVRMIFADAATGAHSPALVRQGRINELVSAKPTARRAILEEAAGVSGLHARRREAILKLDAAARNLERVDELLAGLEDQLGKLTRQAKQATRYRQISEGLRAAELALALTRWREAAQQAQGAQDALTAALTAAAAAETKNQSAARARAEAAEALPPLREEAQVAEAVLQRATLEGEALARRAEEARAGLEAAKARLEQLTQDGARESQLNADAADSIRKLDAELAELERRGAGHEDALMDAQDKARAGEARLAEREAEHDAASQDAARRAAQAEAAARRMREAETALARADRAATEAMTAADALRASLPQKDGAAKAASQAAQAAQAQVEAAETEASASEARRAASESTERDARAAASAAGGETAALKAEVESLRKLLARSAASGVRMLDKIRVAPGYEAALGAALGDDLDAPEAQDGEGGWTAPGAYGDARLPDGAAPLAPQVDAPAALARRLERVAVIARETGDAAQAGLGPGWRLVSIEGDLWRWDGLRRRAGERPSEAAQRLQTANRLEAAEAAFVEADSRRSDAQSAHDSARAALKDATEAEAQARAARRKAEAAATEAARAESRAAGERDLAQGRLETLAAAATARAEELDLAKAESQAAAEAAREVGNPEEARNRAAEARKAVDEARAAAQTLRARVDELRRAEAGRARRRDQARKDRAGWAQRLGAAESRARELENRIETAEAERARALLAPGEIAAEREKIAAALETAQARRRAAVDRLDAAESASREADQAERAAARAASEAAEARARCEALGDAARQREEEARAELLEAEPAGAERAAERLPEDAPGDAASAEIEIAKLTRQRDALGAVNLRAEEDAREVAAERDALQTERADLDAAIAKLRQGVAELNREGRARLLDAFDAVDSAFRQLFTHLFGGGEAELALVESDDPLEAGLEIMAMPPGKKLAKLSLLSGGEQTLTALALIFAVFLVNPGPICVLDEVDAPLDDANVARFCDLLDEMTRRADTRFLIITHHAVTMSRMDRLYGVTMVEQGVSQLVSVDLALAAEMASA